MPAAINKYAMCHYDTVIPAPVFTRVNSSGDPIFEFLDTRFHGYDKLHSLILMSVEI
jgi:hypothetical protein